MFTKSKKLTLIDLSSITMAQRGQVKASFDQLQRCRVLAHLRRDKILLGKRRDHNEWQTKSGVCEIRGAGSDLSGAVTNIGGHKAYLRMGPVALLDQLHPRGNKEMDADGC